jgi:hypothetical protein
LKAAYEKAIGHPISDSTVYNVLNRHDWRKLMPRPDEIHASLRSCWMACRPACHGWPPAMASPRSRDHQVQTPPTRRRHSDGTKSKRPLAGGEFRTSHLTEFGPLGDVLRTCGVSPNSQQCLADVGYPWPNGNALVKKCRMPIRRSANRAILCINGGRTLAAGRHDSRVPGVRDRN